MSKNPPNIVVEIDADIAALIQEINASPTSSQQAGFLDAFQDMVVDQLMGPFGLSRAMFTDRDGGPVTTLHNFEQGVTANDADAARHRAWQEAQSSPLERRDYTEAMDDHGHLFESNVDGYTRKELPEGPRVASRDHVVSAGEVERSSRGHLAQTREERVATANQAENLVLTSGSLNSSKQDSDLKDWMARPNAQDPEQTNAEFYGVDEAAAHAAYDEAHEAIDRRQDRAVLKKQAGELAIEAGTAAGKLLVRRLLGLLLKDLMTGVIADIRHLVREGFEDLEALAALARRRLEQTWASVRTRWAEYLKDGAGAAVAGLLASTVTFLVNAFITTVKNVVTMIREAVLSLVRAVRMIVAPPADATGKQVAAEVVKILGAAVAACIGIALEETIAKAMQAIPLLAPIAADVAPVIAGILTGALSLFAVLAFDSLRDRLAFSNKQLADVHRGQAVNLLQLKRTFVVLQGAHVQLALAQDAMAHRFGETRRLVDDARRETRGRIAGYGAAVDGLDDVMKEFE